jgi:hypothetical protein
MTKRIIFRRLESFKNPADAVTTIRPLRILDANEIFDVTSARGIRSEMSHPLRASSQFAANWPHRTLRISQPWRVHHRTHRNRGGDGDALLAATDSRSI